MSTDTATAKPTWVSRWPWAVLAAPLVVLAIGALGFDREAWPELVGDEATYLMAAESLAWDRDLYFTRADYDRFVGHWGRAPEGLILQSGDGGAHLAYAKPFFYPLVISPFVRAAPVRGAFLANALLLAFAGFVTARTLRERLGGQAPLWTAVLLFASVAFAYAFWAHADLFLMVAVAVALALRFRSPADESRAGTVARYAIVGLLLGVVAFSRPFYATLFLPAVLFVPARRRRLALTSLAAAALSLTLAAAALHWSAGGSWSGYGGERRAFYSYTGFPTVELAADDWDRLIEVSGNAAWSEVERPLAPVGTNPRLLGWNAAYFLAGRHVGLLPYFLPLLLGFLGRSRDHPRWPLLAAVALTVVAFFLYRPFNFYGGGAAIANRYFLPLYPAFWFLLNGRRSALWPGLVALAAAPFLLPLWLSAATPPRSASTGFTHVSRVAVTALPFETTQSHLQPSGEKDLVHNGLWMRFLTPGLAAGEDSSTLTAQRQHELELLIGTSTDLEQLELRILDGASELPQLERHTFGAAAATGTGTVEIDPGKPAAIHPTWWTEEPFRMYRLRLRWPEPGEPVVFSLTPSFAGDAGPES